MEKGGFKGGGWKGSRIEVLWKYKGGDTEQGGNNGDEGDKHKSKLSIMKMPGAGEVVT